MKMLRTQGSEGAIWKLSSTRAPVRCPECKCEHQLQYVGFAETYSAGMHAKMYVCSVCDTWVDCIWPKSIGKTLTFTEHEGADDASVSY